MLRCELRVQGQIRHAYHAVQRRANFVAHVSQEFALGPIGFFRCIPCAAHLRLGLLTFGNLLLEFFGASQDANFQLLLRPLQGHVPFLDAFEHLVEGSNQFSQLILPCRACAQRVVFPCGNSLGQARKLQDGLRDEIYQSLGDESCCEQGDDQNKGGNFPESRHLGGECRQIRDDRDGSPRFAFQGDALRECQEVSRESDTFLMAGRRFTR